MRTAVLLAAVALLMAGCDQRWPGGAPPWATTTVAPAETTTSTVAPAPDTTAPADTTTSTPDTTVPATTATTTSATTDPGGDADGSWPTAETTGVSDPDLLEPWTGDCTFRTDGEVIENRILDCQVDVYASGVTFRNSIIRGGEYWGVHVRETDGAPIILDHVTFEPASGCLDGSIAIMPSNYHATAVEVVGFGDAFRYSGDDTIVEDSYAKLCAREGSGAHSDGMQGYGAADATPERPNIFRHNTIDQRCYSETGNQADQACSVTAPVFWADDSGDGLVVADNLLRGGGYTIRVDSGTGHQVTGNLVEVDSYGYGPVSSECGAIADWSGNRLVTVGADGQPAEERGDLACG